MFSIVVRVAEGLALLGGLLLLTLALMVTVSVGGRALIPLGLGPVPGDFELVEMGSAIVVFFFLPWCHLRGGHAAVDLLVLHFPRGAQRLVLAVGDVLMLLVWLVLTWRLALGLLDKWRSAETTFILQLPLWWAYAACLLAAVLGCGVYAACGLRRLARRDATGAALA